MAMAGTTGGRLARRLRWRALAARVRGWCHDGSDRSAARRIAGGAFLIRVVSAGIIYLSQVLLARWMGRFEFGIYVYVWSWVGFLGMLSPIGLAYSAQRFIPEYRAHKDYDGLRGFLRGSRRCRSSWSTASSSCSPMSTSWSCRRSSDRARSRCTTRRLRRW